MTQSKAEEMDKQAREERDKAERFMLQKCVRMGDTIDAGLVQDWLVQYAAQVREQSKWVSVAERLPDDDSEVFAAVWWINRDKPELSCYAIHDCSYYEGGAGSGQKIFADNEGQEFEPVDVAYWVYKKTLAETLPAPPSTSQGQDTEQDGKSTL